MNEMMWRAAVIGAICTSTALACDAATTETNASTSASVQAAIHVESPVPQPSTCKLSYHGGAVLSNVKVYAVFWGPNIDVQTQSKIGLFYSDVLQSTYFDFLAQYNTAGVTDADGGTSNQGIGRGSFGGHFTIQPSACASDPCTLYYDQIEDELLAQIRAGNLPAPTLGCSGTVDSLYMIEFPPRVVIKDPAAPFQNTSCEGFCAFHSATAGTYSVGGADVHVPYGVHPDMAPGSRCDGICGKNANYFDNITVVHSHELVEAVTDPMNGGFRLGPPPPNPIGPLAWYANNECSPEGEIGDLCNAIPGTISVNGHTWTVQAQWSNRSSACVVSDSFDAVCNYPSMAPCRACTCADLGASCSGATPACETDVGNPKYGSCVECASNDECGSGGVCQKTTTATTDDTCTVPCTPTTCAAQGKDCGVIANGCGGRLSCGSCAGATYCGGGGVPNVCGCAPTTCAVEHAACGTIGDSCGHTIDCGACIASRVCVNRQCVPAPLLDAGAADALADAAEDAAVHDAANDAPEAAPARTADASDVEAPPSTFVPGGGCACRAVRSRSNAPWAPVIAALILASRRRRR